MAEGRDWARTQFEACPDCGRDATAIADPDLPAALVDAAAAWSRLLNDANVEAARARPAPDVWSPLEYACHSRDVVWVFNQRVRDTEVRPGQQLGWWDHDASVIDDRYNEQQVLFVAEEIEAAADALAATLTRLDAAAWDAPAERRPGEHFTIRGMARFALHELLHHRWDAAQILASER